MSWWQLDVLYCWTGQCVCVRGRGSFITRIPFLPLGVTTKDTRFAPWFTTSCLSAFLRTSKHTTTSNKQPTFIQTENNLHSMRNHIFIPSTIDINSARPSKPPAAPDSAAINSRDIDIPQQINQYNILIYS